MTTPYFVQLAPAAVRQLLALTPKTQKIMLKFIEALAVNPRPPGARKIEGMMGLYCEILDHIRIIYKVEEQEVLILLIK